MFDRPLTSMLAVLAAAGAAQAQLNIDWYTIDGGGGSSAGGAFSVSGTTGQPDAATSAGGTFVCAGGFWGAFAGTACYANCDGSTGSPLLTANDFTCFINAYAAASSAANCDQSTGNPLLTANDFTCFINAYATGCP